MRATNSIDDDPTTWEYPLWLAGVLLVFMLGVVIDCLYRQWDG